jgi:hypothetical protein
MTNSRIYFVFFFFCLLSVDGLAQNHQFKSNRFQLLCNTTQSVYLTTDSLKPLKKEGAKSEKTPKKHYPKVATIMSAVVPGAGQIYNEKYWKAPIVWAGMGACIFFVRSNHILYKDYKGALLQRTDTSSIEPDKYLDIYSADQLIALQDQYRQSRDLFIIASSLVYVLNIVDALVDAHLFSFDVSDDLSLNWQPFYRYNVNTSNTAGLSLRLTLR